MNWQQLIDELPKSEWFKLDKHMRFAYLHYQIPRESNSEYVKHLRDLKRYLGYGV